MFRSCAPLLNFARAASVAFRNKLENPTERKRQQQQNGTIRKPFVATKALSVLALVAIQWKKWVYPIFPELKATDGDNLAERVHTAVDAILLSFYNIPFVKENIENKKNKKDADDSKNDKKQKDKRRLKNHRATFREKTIIRYENRLRQYSTPEKIFRYFATLRIVNSQGQSEICMTPKDFLRSIYPNMQQPEGLGLDKYRLYNAQRDKDQGLPANSIFYKMSPDGVITFTDYVLLLMMISLPERFFEIGFQMFDLNGDGEVDIDDFALLLALFNSQSHHQTLRTDSSSLKTFFFGPKCDKKLTISQFKDFQRQLNNDILLLEYNFLKKDKIIISELDFAEMVLAYSNMPESVKHVKLERVRNRYRNSPGITQIEYMNFFKFVKDIQIVDTALSFYHLAGVGVDHKTMKHVTKTVVGVQLSDHVINVLFTIFDDDNDGHLSRREFCIIIRDRLFRKMGRNDISIFTLGGSIFKCAKERLL